MCVCVYTCYALSHVQVCKPLDYSLPGSSIHGIFQAIILEWFACICECIKRFIIRHWFMWLWRLTNPKIWSPNLETQERQWYSWSQQPQYSEGDSILVQNQKTGKIQCRTSKAIRQEEFSLIWGKFSIFFLNLLGLHLIGWGPPTLGREICFIWFTNSNVMCWYAQSWLTLCKPMDYSPPCSSVLGIFQARILEWVSISFSREFKC